MPMKRHKNRNRIEGGHRLLRHTTVAVLILCAAAIPLRSQSAADYFKQNCASCHSIGGGTLTGPDLKNVSERKDRSWLIDFIVDPKAVIDRGDPYALQLLEEARGVIMPTLPTMTRERAAELLDLIARESALEESQFKGVQIDDRPFTQEDITKGRKLFTGEQRLQSAGASCISCHSVYGLGGLGGGMLAPDLTTVFERYKDRTTLVTWLTAPATPTMQAVFADAPLTTDEAISLTAFFEHTLRRNPADASTARLNFMLIGLGGVVLLLGLFDVIWHNRFRSVRRAMIQQWRRNRDKRVTSEE